MASYQYDRGALMEATKNFIGKCKKTGHLSAIPNRPFLADNGSRPLKYPAVITRPAFELIYNHRKLKLWGHIWFTPRCKIKFTCDEKNIASIYPALR